VTQAGKYKRPIPDISENTLYFILMHHFETNTTPLTLTLTPEHLGLRFDVVLAQLLPQFSRSRIQQWCESGHVHQQNVPVIANARVKKIVPIVVQPQTEDSLKAFAAEDLALNVVFEDRHLAVIYKPVGMVVHPGAGNWTGTLMNGLLHRYPASSSLPRAGIVHRLDRDTSGLMVVAKDSQTYNTLVDALKARTVQRRYVAITHGVPTWMTMRVDAPIGRDPKLRTRMAVVPGTVARPSTGKSAITDTRVLASNMAAGVALVECKLHTGRTHQIRVHLSHIRHCLIGDATYGGKPLLGMNRQALHAWSLSFAHPITGKTITNHCAPPTDMLDALTSMGVQWPSLETALLASPGFEVALEEPTEHAEAIFEFGEDDFDEDDDFDESGVEVIYVRD
jgi:23S rRNA pseudouridine1911/1915/1917 synthase